jgi:hypothetical protein
MLQTVPQGAAPWAFLAAWPAWRGLRESLEQLRDLLRSAAALAAGAGSGMGDLAEAIDELLTDPAGLYGALPAGYSVRCSLKKAGPGPVDDLESELLGWLQELARWVNDGPVLLEAGEAAEAMGQALTTEVPRAWQARFAGLIAGLRQMVQAAGRKGSRGIGREAGLAGGGRDAGPLGGGLDAGLPGGRGAAVPGPGSSGTGPAPVRPWAPRWIARTPDGYAVILPDAAEAAPGPVLRQAAVELACCLLADLGPDAFRLHLRLLCTEPGAAVDVGQVREALGLGAGHRRHAAAEAARCYGAAVALRQLRLSLYRWSSGEGAVALRHEARDLWEFRVREYGQARLMERDGTLAARGEEWAIAPGEGSWAFSLPPGVREELALLGRGLLGEAGSTPAGLGLGALLALGGAPPVSVANGAILALAGAVRPEGGPGPDGDSGPDGLPGPALRDLWRQVRQAMRLQEAWGWRPDPAPWHDEWNRRMRRKADEAPETPRERESFLQATTVFQRTTTQES